MRKILFAAAAVLGAYGLPVRAQSLQQALSMAYRNNPTLLGEQANQRAIAENSAQTRSGWRPTLTMHMDAQYQQGPYATAFGLGSVTSNDAEGYLSLKQPIYTFGHVANQVRAADARSRAEGHNLRQIEATTFTAVINAYMDVLRDQYILDVRKADVQTLTQQVNITTSRYNLGGQPTEQMTRTDVEQAETRRQSALVAFAQAEATLAASRATFHVVVGVDPENLAQPDALPGLPTSLPDAMSMATQSNPALAAMRATQAATSADIDTARSQWGPQIDVQASLGTIGNAQPFHGREFGQETTGYVELVQPLYNGDLYNSQIRQARARDAQARQNIELAKRQAAQAVVTNWRAVENGLTAIQAGIAEVQAGQTALRGYQAEYGYGLRTTTDVLYADQILRAAQVELAGSRHDTIVAEAQLLAAIGRLQAVYILPNERHYDAEAKYQQARTRGWMPLQAPIAALDKAGWQ